MKKLNELSLRSITIIQIVVALLITIIFQFIVPLSWQPLDVYTLGPDVKHGTPGANIVVFAISQWYFSLSIAWFLKRDNKYLNNFLAYAVVPLTSIIVPEFFIIGLYYDYIHLIPFIVSVFILFRKRDSVFPKYVIYYLIILGVWLIIDYVFKLAYYDTTLLEFILNGIFLLIFTIILSLIIRFSHTYKKKS